MGPGHITSFPPVTFSCGFRWERIELTEFVRANLIKLSLVCPKLFDHTLMNNSDCQLSE